MPPLRALVKDPGNAMHHSKRYIKTLEQFAFEDLVEELGSLVAAIGAGLLTPAEKEEYAAKRGLVMAEISRRLDDETG